MKKLEYIFFCLGICLSACVKPIEELPPTTPPMVESLEYDPFTRTFTGQANSLGDGIKDHGFVWSVVVAVPTLEESQAESLGKTDVVGTFSVQVDSFPEGVEVNARAYLTDIYERNFYGKVLSFNTIEQFVKLTTSPFESNLVDQFTGSINGQITQFSTNNIVEHGHCWGLDIPTIDSNRTNLLFPASFDPPYEFVSNLDSGAYKHGITYQIRSYAKDEKGNVFYGNILAFKISNFWENMTVPIDFMGEGSAMVLREGTDSPGDIVLIRSACDAGDFWVYNFRNKSWDHSNQSLPTSKKQGVSFVLPNNIGARRYLDHAYYGGGRLCPGTTGSHSPYLLKFWDIFFEPWWDGGAGESPYEVQTTEGDTVVGSGGVEMIDFYDGISVVLDGNVYMGLGSYNQYSPDINWPQLIKYSGDNSRFEVLRTTRTATHGAVGFGVQGKLYFGLGKILDPDSYPAEPCFNEINVYDPMTGFGNSYSYPNGPRIDATAFVIGNKAYLGIGYEALIDREGGCTQGSIQHDFWSFDPSKQFSEWSQMVNFPGTLVPTFSFVHDNIGYIGAGGEIWTYYPDLE